LAFGQAQVQMDCPYLINQLFPHGAVELRTKEGVWFKVNGERIKPYSGHTESANEGIEAYHLDEGSVIKRPQSRRNVKSGACREQPNTNNFYFL